MRIIPNAHPSTTHRAEYVIKLQDPFRSILVLYAGIPAHTSYSLQRTQTKPFEEKRKGYTKIRLCGFLHCNSVVAVERARVKLQTEKMARTPKTYTSATFSG